MAKGKGTV